MPSVKKARIHSVSLFFWKGREGGGKVPSPVTDWVLIGYKNDFYPIRSRRGVDKNAGKLAAAGRRGRKAKKEKTFMVAKQL